MRVLILSCNTGEGHNSCASALQETFELNGDNCEIADALQFISKGTSDFISEWHSRIYRYMPGLFRNGYHFAEEHPAVFQEHSAAAKLMVSGAEKLGDYIRDGKYDAVICTHVFSAMILTYTIQDASIHPKTYFVSTDYTCAPSTEDSNLDIYFLPSEKIADAYIERGIPHGKLIFSGIPVRKMFYDSMDRAEAKRIIGIPEQHHHLLLMCGSMGCGPIPELVASLLDSAPENMDFTVICGTNQGLYQHLTRSYSHVSNAHILDYSGNISLLMDSAELYLTKPGGISVTEAAVKRLPMVLLNAVDGCERYNRDFFVNTGGAVTENNMNSLAALSLSILSDENRLLKMSECLLRARQPYAAETIYRYVKGV